MGQVTKAAVKNQAPPDGLPGPTYTALTGAFAAALIPGEDCDRQQRGRAPPDGGRLPADGQRHNIRDRSRSARDREGLYADH
jgi:hypothetical protein